MTVTRIKIKRLAPVNGLIGFCSFVIDNWLYVGNIAVYSRRDKEGEVRLVFPERKLKEKTICLVHPLQASKYFELEQLVKAKFSEI